MNNLSLEELFEKHKKRAYAFREFYIPVRMMHGIENYVMYGIPPGHFLTAVICNDLKEACARADDENLPNLFAYVAFFYNEMPYECWGSRERMTAWIDRKKAELGQHAALS